MRYIDDFVRSQQDYVFKRFEHLIYTNRRCVSVSVTYQSAIFFTLTPLPKRGGGVSPPFLPHILFTPNPPLFSFFPSPPQIGRAHV